MQDTVVYFSVFYLLTFMLCYYLIAKPARGKGLRIFYMSVFPLLIFSVLAAIVMLLLTAPGERGVVTFVQNFGGSMGGAFVPHIILLLIFVIAELLRASSKGRKNK